MTIEVLNHSLQS